jgi:hypothetical protein
MFAAERPAAASHILMIYDYLVYSFGRREWLS